MADNKYAKALLNYVQMPMAQLGAVFGTTPQKMSQALRQEGSNIYDSMKSAVTAPGRALKGQMNPQMMMDENGNIIQDDSRMNQEAMNLAMNIAGGGFGSTLAKPAEAGSLGMFIGKRSPSWNQEKANLFAQLESKGVSPKEAWHQTGTMRGPEGKLRQEISDVGSGITDNVYEGIKANKRFEGPMSTALVHPELYKAYPEVGNINTGMYAWHEPTGDFDRATNTITVGGPSTGLQRSGALHEINHAIENVENWARGGNPQQFEGLSKMQDYFMNRGDESLLRAERARKNKGIDPESGLSLKDIQEQQKLYENKVKDLRSQGALFSPEEAYKRLAGEAQARMVQNRRFLTPEERLQHFPYEEGKYGLDVPWNELIINK